MTRFFTFLALALVLALALAPTASAAADRDTGSDGWLAPLRHVVDWVTSGLGGFLPPAETLQRSEAPEPPEGGGEGDGGQTVDPNHGAMIIVDG